MAVITKLAKGYDVDYPFKQQGRWAGDYFDVKGEPRGRWWGLARPRWAPASGCERHEGQPRLAQPRHRPAQARIPLSSLASLIAPATRSAATWQERRPCAMHSACQVLMSRSPRIRTVTVT